MGPEPDATQWRESWAVIWKAHDRPLVRSYLWSIGFQPSAESALGRVEQTMKEDPAFHAKSLGGTFYPVRIDMNLKCEESLIAKPVFVEAGKR